MPTGGSTGWMLWCSLKPRVRLLSDKARITWLFGKFVEGQPLRAEVKYQFANPGIAWLIDERVSIA